VPDRILAGNPAAQIEPYLSLSAYVNGLPVPGGCVVRVHALVFSLELHKLPDFPFCDTISGKFDACRVRDLFQHAVLISKNFSEPTGTIHAQEYASWSTGKTARL
jgi:hypothetical protein